MSIFRHFTVGALLCGLLSAPLPSFAGKESGKWEFVSSKDGVVVHRKKVPGSNLFAFRGVLTAQIHIGKLVTVLSKANLRKKWVHQYHSSGPLEKPSELERVYWIRFDLPWPAWDRDFVFYTKAYPDVVKRTFIARVRSTKHKRFPKQKCCVRAFASKTYYKFTAFKVPKGSTARPKTMLEVEVHTDPKGWLPAWLINRTQATWPNRTLRNLIGLARKQKPYPLMEFWHSHRPLYEHYKNLPKGFKLPKGFTFPKGYLPKNFMPKVAPDKTTPNKAAPRPSPRPAPTKK